MLGWNEMIQKCGRVISMCFSIVVKKWMIEKEERERERVREGKRMKGKEEEKEDGKERTVKVELKTSSWSSKVTENIIRH